VEGLMQDYELSLQHVLWRVERLHQNKEVVTKRDEGIHRTTYGEMVPRINRLAGALKRIGVKPGDRVATLAWNNNRHLELYSGSSRNISSSSSMTPKTRFYLSTSRCFLC